MSTHSPAPMESVKRDFIAQAREFELDKNDPFARTANSTNKRVLRKMVSKYNKQRYIQRVENKP